MQIEYRPAQLQDLDEIFMMVQCAIRHMDALGLHQWDETYPTRQDLYEDIAKGEMCTGRTEGRIAVIYVLNTEQEKEYLTADWQHPEKPYRVLHRLCVHPELQNMGIARRTLEHIQQELIEAGIEVLRLDAFSKNPHTQRLYRKAGFHPTGIITEPIGDFIIMEKYLTQEEAP